MLINSRQDVEWYIHIPPSRLRLRHPHSFWREITAIQTYINDSGVRYLRRSAVVSFTGGPTSPNCREKKRKEDVRWAASEVNVVCNPPDTGRLTLTDRSQVSGIGLDEVSSLECDAYCMKSQWSEVKVEEVRMYYDSGMDREEEAYISRFAFALNQAPATDKPCLNVSKDDKGGRIQTGAHAASPAVLVLLMAAAEISLKNQNIQSNTHSLKLKLKTAAGRGHSDDVSLFGDWEGKEITYERQDRHCDLRGRSRRGGQNESIPAVSSCACQTRRSRSAGGGGMQAAAGVVSEGGGSEGGGAVAVEGGDDVTEGRRGFQYARMWKKTNN
ncbi:hypothetical protein B0H19DRAFT_1065365 [Mycena capillaripes]|nr:hypothetical protein B0H19DRAFT_1065365 [Mycena capillaripes]